MPAQSSRSIGFLMLLGSSLTLCGLICNNNAMLSPSLLRYDPSCSFSGWHIPVHTHTRGNHLPLPHECESPNLNGGRLTNQGGTGVATTTTSGVVVATHDRTSDS